MASWASRLLGHSTSIPVAQVRMMLPVATMSAFINHTPIVVMWLPVLDDWAKKHRISPSKLMMPLSYAAILGGGCATYKQNLMLKTPDDFKSAAVSKEIREAERGSHRQRCAGLHAAARRLAAAARRNPGEPLAG